MFNSCMMKLNSGKYGLNKCTCFIIFIAAASLLLLTSCELDSDGSLPENTITTSDPEVIDEKAESERPEGLDDPKDTHYPYQLEENAQVESETVPKVALYNGSGIWVDNVDTLIEFFTSYDIKYDLVDENSINEIDLNNFEIIVLPGGFAAEYRYEISDHDRIRSFVEDGGLFVGFCAGAYYAADVFSWKGVEYDYPLEIFTGKSIGPLIGQVGWGEQALLNLNPEHPVNENFEQSLDIYYFDGPYFIPYDFEDINTGKIEVLANYDVNDQPAVIAGRFGEGGYLLFGPHPEMDGYNEDEGSNWPWLYSSLLWFSNW